jgi:hypothetical protein
MINLSIAVALLAASGILLIACTDYRHAVKKSLL